MYAKEKIKKSAFFCAPIWVCLLLLCACTQRQSLPVTQEVTFEIQPSLQSKPATASLHPVAPITVILDAGHGGNDEGTASDPDHYQEKALTLRTVLLLKQKLQKMGYRILLTRSKDVFIPLDKRVTIANQAKADLFVSIHYNSAPNKEAKGIEVYFFDSKNNLKRAAESKKLAQKVLQEMIKETGAHSRGVRSSNFAVIKSTNMAAILIEGGFLTNTGDRKKIKSQAYLEKLSAGIAKGIDEYFK